MLLNEVVGRDDDPESIALDDMEALKERADEP